MFRPTSLVVASLLLAAPAVAAEDRSPTATPGDAVQSFYAFHMTHDMGFSREAVSERAAWLIHDVRYVSGPSFRTILGR